MPGTTPAPSIFVYAALALATGVSAQSWLPTSPFPAWGAGAPTNVITLAWNPAMTAAQNGDTLANTAEALLPGQSLSVGPGVWSVAQRFDMSVQGTASQPIRIFATDPNNRPVITRPDVNQNLLNVGGNSPSRYLILQNLELHGGSDLLRIYDGSYTWIDNCYLHDGGGVGIAVQTISCSNLFITRCEIARPGPGTPGEGMYLGNASGSVTVTDSVVAFNYVHDMRGAQNGQGDGIEVKQNSTRNWVVGNHVHDCKNPCILVYGTGGVNENVVEYNLMYDSDDVVFQVQGEAIVRNNIAIGGAMAFDSHDHQGTSRNLKLIHNTFINAGRAALLMHWGGRPGMVLANNVIYSTTAESVWFGTGDAGVTAAGNVVFGATNKTGGGYQFGTGLGDFVGVSLQPLAIDARPRVGGPIDNRGHPAWQLPLDQAFGLRTLPADPGARANLPSLVANVATLPVSGGTQQLTFDLGPTHGSSGYLLAASTSGTASSIVANGFHLPLAPDWLFALSVSGGLNGILQNGTGVLPATGRTNVAVVVPPLGPAGVGLTIAMSMIVVQNNLITHVSNPATLRMQ